MTHNQDIFSLKNVEDIPEHIQKDLSFNKKHGLSKRIIYLITIAERPLGIDEIMVGLYRKFGVKKSKNQIHRKMYYMNKDGHVKRGSKKGTYYV